jgi:hypothetical protein
VPHERNDGRLKPLRWALNPIQFRGWSKTLVES